MTGRGATIVIVDSYGSPTIRNDLAAFDRAYRLPAPPKFQIIRPAGRIPAYDPASSDMVGWAGETTLDVEWAHVVAPGANLLLVETPVSETEGVHGFPQIIAAEKYVLNHHLGDVISQSFSATEETFPKQDQRSSPCAAPTSWPNKDHVTVLTASGDAGAADVGLDQTTYYAFPVTSWPDSDPLVTGVGGTQLHFTAKGAPAAPDRVERHVRHQGQRVHRRQQRPQPAGQRRRPVDVLRPAGATRTACATWCAAAAACRTSR